MCHGGPWTGAEGGHCVKLGRQSLDFLGDPKKLEVPELWDLSSGELLTGSVISLREKSVSQSTELKGVGDLKSVLTSNTGMQSMEQPS